MNNSFESNDALISKLDFGQDSAESEREFLQKVFIPTSLFSRIKNGKKQLVLGRKGAGKTAVCLTLYENLNHQKARVSLVTPRDLSKFKMVMLNQGSINLSEASLLSWKYTLYVEICIYIMEAAYTRYGKNYLTWPDPAQQIRKFLADNVESKANWIDKTFKIASAIRKIGFKIFDVGVDLDTMPNVSTLLAEQMEDLTDVILNGLELFIKDPIYILIDKVDELWEPGAESESLLVGLLRATKELGEQITGVKVIVFLRSDIYDALKFHDSDKFHSLEERIIWNKDDLKKLVSLRARASTGLSINRTAYDTIWNTFFPKKIRETESFETLMLYTLMRPRDLIQLCNKCRDRAQNNGHKKIEIGDFFDALPLYSDWKLKDLRDEYRVQYPFLQKVLFALFHRKSPQFSRKQIVEYFERVKAKLIDEFGDLYFDPIDNLLQVLYNIGFLGAVLNGKTLYSFDDEKVLAAYIVNFEIHPAFRLALAAEEFKDYETGFIDQTAGDQSVQIRAGSDIIVNQNIGEVAGGTVVGGIIGRSGVSADDANLEKLFELLEDKIKARLEDPNVDKLEIQEQVNQIKNEAAQGEKANPNKLERWIRNLSAMAPDIVEVMATSLGGPITELTAVIQKIAARVKAESENKG